MSRALHVVMLMTWVMVCASCSRNPDPPGLIVGGDGPKTCSERPDGSPDCSDADCAGRACSPDGAAWCAEGECALGESGGTCLDGLDNDRDGVTDCADADCAGTCACGECDEGCTTASLSEGCACTFGGSSVGVCAAGVRASSGACAQPTRYQATERACDGLDNDCDGVVDEGCNCSFTGSSFGVCAFAIVGDFEGRCRRPDTYEVNETLCDGRDNDCDGSIDEGCEVCEVAGSGEGACGFGIAGGADAPDECFVPGAYELEERSCDGIDNDCDGDVDEGCGCPFDDSWIGVCGLGLRSSEGECGAPDGYEEEESSCDGRDNDCDGITDEGCPRCPFNGTPLGACNFGVISDAGACIEPIGFEVEEVSCTDGIDNDCDGLADVLDPACQNPGELCTNGEDDDRDGLIDCDDDECQGGPCGHVIFTTRRATTAFVGGLNGADRVCTQAARRAGMIGQFKAILSAQERFPEQGSWGSEAVMARERIDVRGPVFANNAPRRALALPAGQEASLLGGSRAAVTAFDEYRAPVRGFVWTGTTADGEISRSAVPDGNRSCFAFKARPGGSTESIADVLGDGATTVSPADLSDPSFSDSHLGGGSKGCYGRGHLLCISGQGRAKEQCGLDGDADKDGYPTRPRPNLTQDPDCTILTEADACMNGLDDDADGLTDCDDPECFGEVCGHVVFVTPDANDVDELDSDQSTWFDGDLGGLARADALCQTAAEDAGRDGVWKAVLAGSQPGEALTERIVQRGAIFNSAPDPDCPSGPGPQPPKDVCSRMPTLASILPPPEGLGPRPRPIDVPLGFDRFGQSVDDGPNDLEGQPIWLGGEGKTCNGWTEAGEAWQIDVFSEPTALLGREPPIMVRPELTRCGSNTGKARILCISGQGGQP